MNIPELMEGILTLCPQASLNYDDEGQIVVYTNLIHAEEGDELVEFEPAS